MAIASLIEGPNEGGGTKDGIQRLQIKGRTYLRSLGGVKVGKKGRGVQTWGTSAYWNTKWKLLTPEQQQAWHDYAETTLQAPMKGWAGLTDGRASFQGFNFANRWNGGQFVQTSPPALPVILPSPCPRVSRWLVNTATGYKFELIDNVDAGYRIVVGAFAPQLSNAKPNLKTCLKIAEFVGPVSPGLIGPLLADYKTVWGPMPDAVKQWYRFWIVKENQSCSMGDACAPLASGPPPPPPPGTFAWSFGGYYTDAVLPITVTITIDGVTLAPMVTDSAHQWGFEADTDASVFINAAWIRQGTATGPFAFGSAVINVNSASFVAASALNMGVAKFEYIDPTGWQQIAQWSCPDTSWQPNKTWSWIG